MKFIIGSFYFGDMSFDFTYQKKVAFSHRGQMGLSFLRTDEHNYYPELEFYFFCFILNGSNYISNKDRKLL